MLKINSLIAIRIPPSTSNCPLTVACSFGLSLILSLSSTQPIKYLMKNGNYVHLYWTYNLHKISFHNDNSSVRVNVKSYLEPIVLTNLMKNIQKFIETETCFENGENATISK